MIGEIDIESFLDSDHSDFMQHQRTNDGISYTLAHAIAAILVEKDHDSIVGSLIHSSQGEKCSRLMENLYPGGIKGLETDLLELIGY